MHSVEECIDDRDVGFDVALVADEVHVLESDLHLSALDTVRIDIVVRIDVDIGLEGKGIGAASFVSINGG
ncbi:hypothetical protein D3C87_2002650 [compost metagenome]